MKQPSLFDAPDPPDPAGPSGRPPDHAARAFAIEPGNDVVLEASAGTGKTRVLVDRYVRLIEKGVDPRNILAITFTRKAAAEMRERVLAALRQRAAQGGIAPDTWRALRHRIADIQISTIDAFCFGLLREFPLEAGVEPGFDIADETEMGRFAREAMDRALRVARALFAEDEALRLLFTRVKAPVLADAVQGLLDRRHIALPAVAGFVRRQPPGASSAEAADAFVDRLRAVFEGSSHRRALMEHGPHGVAEFDWLHADLTSLATFTAGTSMPRIQQLRHRLERYFLTKSGEPRKKTTPSIKAQQFADAAAKRAHDEAVLSLAPAVLDALNDLKARINAMLARGLLRLLRIASDAYERLLEEHALLDFAGMLDKAVALLSQQEEFARSRLKLQARYHHVLVDEFQDTSRQQWRLVELLVDAWGEGEGASDAPTSIFIVGDRKQSIYRFRHAEVTLLDEAARKIAALRPGRAVRQAIQQSYRAVPELLAFVNALAEATQSTGELAERFTYADHDRFPAPGIADGALRDGQPVLGVIAETSMAACAAAVAAEASRLIGHATVRDRDGATRPARPEDIGILFRARPGHQLFETALEARGIRTYVYKGLGFFDAPEVQDLQALLRVLAQPDSDLRAAEWLRSRFVRLSDDGLIQLAPSFSAALLGARPEAAAALGDLDRALLDHARADLARWLDAADRLPPSEVLDLVIREAAFVRELRGRRLHQARENLKKVRGLVRRVESRGYATLGRIAEYFETLRTGEESNAILEASGCVQLMTMHAAKGLEFSIVFLVNLQMPGRGRSGGFTVVDRGPSGEPEVAFASSDVTRLEDERDAEELRRLLYVGVTRAKDRLYLAAQVDDRGQLRRTARSLAGLLPASLIGVFQEAALAPVDRVTWATAGASFVFDVCRPGDLPEATALPETAADDVPVDVAPLGVARRAPIAAAELDVDSTADRRPTRGRKRKASVDTDVAPAPASDRLLGTIVHRLFQRDIDPAIAATELARWLPDLIAPEERVDLSDVEAFIADAGALYRRLRARPDVTALLASGECHYELPFSFAPSDRPGDLIRGVIDCLVVPVVGPPTVVEFKTGEPRPEHEAQAAGYLAAIRAVLGQNDVNVKILYA